jgi:hypothetical protein
MRTSNILAVALTFVLTAAPLAQGSDEKSGKTAPKATASQPIVMPAGDLKWADLDPQGAPEGKPEFRLGPGSYFLQPGGNYRHTTSCGKASECLFFVESKGKFDLKPVAAEKAPATK